MGILHRVNLRPLSKTLSDGFLTSPRHLSRFIRQSLSEDGSAFQVRLVGSSGLAALNEPIKIFKYLFEEDSFLQDKFLRKNSRVLDHGCGVGRFSVVLRAAGKHPKNLIGVDVLEDCISNYKNIAQARSFSVRDKSIVDWVGEEYFDASISYSVFSHLPLDKAKSTLDDLFSATSKKGIIVLTIWNHRLISRLKSTGSSSNNYWWENLKKTIGKFGEGELENAGYLFAPNSGGDGLPAEIYGDMVYSDKFFKSMAEEIGWGIRATINDDSLTPQTIIVLEKF